jgi:polysaccharide pyruvyl transferase WcaK-like protein
MAWPLRGLAPVRRLLMTIPYFRAISEADAVIDLCGISFSDGRGLPLLVYNVACCLPALAMGTPVMKLSQAFGPFEEVINRKLATFVLSRCSRVVARGEVSRAHLRQIGFPEAECLPDTSFTLEVGDDDRERARALLQERGVGAGRLTIVSPSEVVRRLSAASSCDFESEMERLLRGLDERGDAIVLLPHSVARDNTKNNDIDLCRRLKRRYGGRAALIDDLENPVLLRAILGEAHIHIGCRFHSVVGALAMGVPTMIIGWSHKYKEMAAPLQGERWALSWEAFEAQSALRVFDELSAVREEVHAQILSALPFVRERAANNYEWLDSFLPLCQRS